MPFFALYFLEHIFQVLSTRETVLQIYGLNLVFLVLMQALIQLGWPFLCRPGSNESKVQQEVVQPQLRGSALRLLLVRPALEPRRDN